MKVVVDVSIPKLNLAVIVARVIPPVVEVVVVPVFAASNENPGAADAGAVLLKKLKLGTLVVDVVDAIVLSRPNLVPVMMVFGVPKVKVVDP